MSLCTHSAIQGEHSSLLGLVSGSPRRVDLEMLVACTSIDAQKFLDAQKFFRCIEIVCMIFSFLDAFLPRQSVSVPVGQPPAGPRHVSRRPAASPHEIALPSSSICSASDRIAVCSCLVLFPICSVSTSSIVIACKKLFFFRLQYVANYDLVPHLPN